MKIGALTLFSRTSSKRTFSLAAWHSPHSLTWRWGLMLHRQPLAWPRPFAVANKMIVGFGVGQLFAVTASRNNTGWRVDMAFLWHSLDLTTQHPMWFKDMFRRARDERDELEREVHSLRRKLDDATFAAVRQVQPDAGAHLN